jgi:glutamine synthetase adenylyltransferase
MVVMRQCKGDTILTRATDRIARRYAADLSCLPPGTPTIEHLKIADEALHQQGYVELGLRLRILRQLVFHRLHALDCEQAASLHTVMQGMTNLAEFCIDQAVLSTHAALVAQHGVPMDQAGKPSQLWVVGMGKLGARELNVSSDIDLIFVFNADGESRSAEASPAASGCAPLANHAFYAKQVQMIQRLLGDVTTHGFVFRVDLALRPFGREGALAISLNGLAQYFQRTGREWERFAWLKSRVLAPVAALPLRAVVRSFVFRRFLDYKVFASLRALHQMIRHHVSPAHRETDVKLGRGGIREIEFAAQVMQIMRGGRQPELLARPTLTALNRLQTTQLMAADVVEHLAQAYDFLRRTEHRIQYLDDAQTHVLPAVREDQIWLATSMGFANWDLYVQALSLHRERVAAIFEHWLTQGEGLRHAEKPTVTLTQLQTKAPWTSQYVRKHPDVVDELNHPDVLAVRFDALHFQHKVTRQYEALQATGLCDEESVLDLLRRAHHIEVFRILVRDAQGLLSVRDVADELSSLADSVLALALPWCWLHVAKRHLDASILAAHFCVIAYGKLGGKELGYGSDLDLVFLYDDDNLEAQQHYIALVRKLITWLTVKTSEGDLYEIDTALRPNGNSGLLVTSLTAYEKYQLQRGSNTAWTWELQAMTRARAVFGDHALSARFDSIRSQVLRSPRDGQQLRLEIAAMRTKLRKAYPVPAGQFDIKHSAGGMIDVEFVVQFWVLAYSALHPSLLGNVGNIELLKIAVAQGLVPAQIGLPAADAYQVLRDHQHAARLHAAKPQVVAGLMTHEQDAVLALWDAVFI